MKYLVTEKNSTRTGYKLMLESGILVSMLAVNEDDYNRIQIGDTLEMLLIVLQPETAEV